MRSTKTLGAVVAAALALASCSPPPSVDLLVPGDCFDYTELTEGIVGIPPVDCALPHEAEVYSIFDLETVHESVYLDEYDEDDINSLSQDACLAAFPDYVGIEYWESEYYYLWLSPTPEGWAEGEREVVCFLVPELGLTLTGSLRGAAS